MPNYSIRYVYHRGGTPVMPPGAPPFPDTLAHHHIISYPRMFAIGALVLCHLKITPRNLTKMAPYHFTNLESIVDSISRIGNTFSLNTSNVALANTLYAIAWTPGNLFVGPSSKLRSDDPSQNQDKNPLSMCTSQQTFITKLSLASSCIQSVIPHQEGEGVSTNSAISIRPFELTTLASHFFEALRIFPNQLNSKVGDWCVVNGSTKYHVYFHIGHTIPSIDLIDFKIAVAQNPRTFDTTSCVKIYGYKDRGQNSVFVGIIVRGMDTYNVQKDEPIEGFIRNCPKVS